MRPVELDRRSEHYWEELIAGEHEPFGGDAGWPPGRVDLLGEPF